MNKEEFFTLAGRYNDGLCSQEEKYIVESFCENVQVDSISSQWSLTEEEKLRVRLLKRITLSVEEFEAVDENRKSILKQYVGFVWKSAAVIILAIGVGYGFYSLNQGTENMPMVAHQTVKSNPKGVKSHIKLPDGSSVWLNAASTISYEQSFSANERNVHLEGEAYFEVVKDAKRPFHVTSGNVVTTALGTSFNIKAYTDKNVKVSLHTGKVKVHKKDSSEQVILLPGQQANAGVSGLAVVEFNNLAVLGWKDGTIVFDNTDFDEMISVLEKWYDVTFVVKNLSLEERREIKVFGEFENQTLDNVLKLLSHSMHFEYGIENKTVTLKFKTDT